MSAAGGVRVARGVGVAGGVRVAVVRGEALNPFEMQAYGRLPDDVDLVLVGRTRPAYEVGALPAPVRLLPGTNGTRLTAAVARRVARVDARADAGRLLGLRAVLADRQIVHAAETAMPLSRQCLDIATRTGARTVLTCWENIAFRFEDDPRTAERKRSVRAGCDLFLAVTPSARAALVAEGVPPGRIAVVPAGVDTDRFAPRDGDSDGDGSDGERVRAAAGVPPGALLVVFVGRLIQEKGVVELVRALARIARCAGRAVHLLLAGEGPDRRRAQAAAAALGCADRLHHVPRTSYADVPSLYAAADVVAAPSLPTPYWQEQFGMVLVEAMASGTALVTTRSGSIPEVVGDAATLVEPYRPDELADALAALLGDDARRAERAAAGRAHAVRHYSLDVVAAQLACAYRGLA